MTTKLFLPILLFFMATAFAVGTSKPAINNNSAANFIRSSCNATLHPHLCYTSLSLYANTVQQSPCQLASVAISVTLTKAQHVASYVSNLTHEADDHDSDSRTTTALRHCFSNLNDAVDDIRESLQQMRQVGSISAGTGFGAGTDLFVFQMSNVKTWMSSALTDANTCTDEFRVVPKGPVKVDVCRRVATMKKLTSIALALVNSYADKGMP